MMCSLLQSPWLQSSGTLLLSYTGLVSARQKYVSVPALLLVTFCKLTKWPVIHERSPTSPYPSRHRWLEAFQISRRSDGAGHLLIFLASLRSWLYYLWQWEGLGLRCFLNRYVNRGRCASGSPERNPHQLATCVVVFATRTENVTADVVMP